MPLQGQHALRTSERARTQAERFEESGGSESATLRDRPITVLTTKGAKTGALEPVQA